MPNHNYELQKPLARTDGLLHTRLKDELVIYDMHRNKAHSLNCVATLVWENCDGQTSVQQLCEILTRELPERVDGQVVWLTLRELEKKHLLAERVGLPSDVISRREAAKRFGKIAVILFPLIVSTVVKAGGCASGYIVCGANCCPPGQQCADGVCIPL